MLFYPAIDIVLLGLSEGQLTRTMLPADDVILSVFMNFSWFFYDFFRPLPLSCTGRCEGITKCYSPLIDA